MTRVKTGGREAGTPNKITKELKTLLKDILTQELETLPEPLNQLEPKERLEILAKLLPFVMPKAEAEKQTTGWGVDAWGA